MALQNDYESVHLQLIIIISNQWLHNIYKNYFKNSWKEYFPNIFAYLLKNINILKTKSQSGTPFERIRLKNIKL